jgi:hypothetical protein
MQEGQDKAKAEARVGWQENCHCYVYTSVHIISYMLSANNIALCLGYK